MLTIALLLLILNSTPSTPNFNPKYTNSNIKNDLVEYDVNRYMEDYSLILDNTGLLGDRSEQIIVHLVYQAYVDYGSVESYETLYDDNITINSSEYFLKQIISPPSSNEIKIEIASVNGEDFSYALAQSFEVSDFKTDLDNWRNKLLSLTNSDAIVYFLLVGGSYTFYIITRLFTEVGFFEKEEN